MADIKYPDYTPVDEPVRTGTKTQEPGSGIRVEKEPAPKPAPKIVKKAECFQLYSFRKREDLQIYLKAHFVV